MRTRYLLLTLSIATHTLLFAAEGPMLGMVLLNGPNTLDNKGVVNELRTVWHLDVNDPEAKDTVAAFIVDGYMLTIALMDAPIPGDEIKEAAGYSYFWENAATEATAHTAHVLVFIMNAGKDPIKENTLFTKLTCAVLNNSSSIGMYMGQRTLLLKKDFYLANAKDMTMEELPLFNWIYFGLREVKGKRAVYTYGMSDFGKPEMEIIKSKHSLAELSEMMYNITHYVLASHVELKSGETIGISAEQKLKITASKGEYVEGTTLKIQY